MIDALAWLALALAALPAGLAAWNLAGLRPPARGPADPDLLVSVLIPARDEEARIGAALATARATTDVRHEILVLDDGSTDATAEVVRRHAAEDPRVRLLAGSPPPAGWAGKNHACQRLADAAAGTHLLFVDADVRLSANAAADLAMHARRHGCALVSGVPRQAMRSPGELLTVPMINFLLLGYLPIARMRAGTTPALGAACGQLLLADAAAYRAVGGHASIRGRIHDALALVRGFRAAGHRTDLVAGAPLADCRMYDGLASAWAGFAKNAHDGMAKPVALPVWTVLLAGGHLLPLPLLLAGAGWPAFAALALSLGTRLAVTLRTGESLWSLPLHPATVATGLAIQWSALARRWRGRPVAWKGRAYHAG
jgi:hypothetical protein